MKPISPESQIAAYPAATPDGKTIVFLLMNAGKPNLWRMDIDGGNLKQLTDSNFDGYPQIAPDNKTIVFIGMHGGKDVLKRMTLDGGTPTVLLDRSVAAPAISPDGKAVAFGIANQELKQWQIGLVPIEGGPMRTLNYPRPYTRWAPDGKSLTYVDTTNGVSNVWAQPISGGPAKQITNFTSDKINWFDWSRGGRLAIERGNSSSDVVLLRPGK